MSTVGLWDGKAPSQEAFSVNRGLSVCVDKHRERREARTDDDSAHGGRARTPTARPATASTAVLHSTADTLQLELR